MAEALWFPTISGKCDGCGGEFRCVEYCQHGVFDVVEGEMRIVKPLSCVPGCANCAPLCPRGAIFFPAGAACHQPQLVRRESPFHRVQCDLCGAEFLTDIEGKNLCFDCDGMGGEGGR